VSQKGEGQGAPSSSDRGAAAFEAAREAAGGSAQELPAIDFATFMLSLGHSALVHLGVAADPASGTHESNLPLARQTIDLVALLEEKTKGNLSGEEERIVEQLLYDLRMRYVDALKSSK
jgi:hypothetical protein